MTSLPPTAAESRAIADADSLAGDLKEHIFKTLANGPHQDSHWVMNMEWLNELRKLEDHGGPLWRPSWTISEPQMLLGIPIEIRADGGVPHLELNHG